jgi:hypothetical protein
MLRIITSTGIVCLIIAFAGCQKTKQVAIAPEGVTAAEVDVSDHQTIALVEFTTNASESIARRATGSFLESFRASHPKARIIELGPEPELLSSVGYRTFSPKALETIREKYGFDAILSGELRFDWNDPAGLIVTWDDLCRYCENAEVDAMLNAHLLDTATGQMIWTNSAQRSATITIAGPDGNQSQPQSADAMPESYESVIVALVRQVAGGGPAGIDDPIVRTANVEP